MRLMAPLISVATMTTPTPTPALTKAIEVACPGCGEATWYSAQNPYRPFCSARCQGHDFGAWASEHYRVNAAPTAAQDEE